MGYCASGCGDIILKENIDIETVKVIVNELSKEHGDLYITFEHCKNPKGYYVYVNDFSTHWDEEVINDVGERLAPYIKEAQLNYSGEEDCIWRYIWDTDGECWEEENATVDYNFESYTDEELIEELVKRGYKVIK